MPILVHGTLASRERAPRHWGWRAANLWVAAFRAGEAFGRRTHRWFILPAGSAQQRVLVSIINSVLLALSCASLRKTIAASVWLPAKLPWHLAQLAIAATKRHRCATGRRSTPHCSLPSAAQETPAHETRCVPPPSPAATPHKTQLPISWPRASPNGAGPVPGKREYHAPKWA